MARIELRGVAHAYVPSPASDKDWALRPLELVWEDGGAYALLGPSGCGKTTLLNIISGLLRPTRGQVLINGVDVTAAPPQARNIAQVFQFPVIYDTMTVAENLAFPLRNRGVGRAETQARVEEVASHLAELLVPSDLVLFKASRAVGLDRAVEETRRLLLARSARSAALSDQPAPCPPGGAVGPCGAPGRKDAQRALLSL